MQRCRWIGSVVAVCLLLVVPAAANAAKFGSRTLKMGSRGGDVKTAQRLLTRAGFETTVDGVFGSGTQSVVMAWERLNKRSVDGQIDRPDSRALKSAAARGAVDPVEDEVVSEDADDEDEDSGGGGLGYVDIEPGDVEDDGTATPSDGAPSVVQAIIAGGNKIFDKPYKYGGGHGKWKDSGYDCSGSVSYALHAAGLLDTSLDSTGFESYGEPGPGMWVTIYANAGHAYMVVDGLRFDTSGASARDGSRWTDEMRPDDGYVVRHPPGL